MIELLLNYVVQAIFLGITIVIFLKLKPFWLDGLEEQIPEYLKIFAQAMFHSEKGSKMGEASGVARGKKAILKAVTVDLANQENPILGTIMSQFPQVADLIASNPNLLPIALDLVQQFNFGNGSGSTISDFAERLKTYG